MRIKIDVDRCNLCGACVQVCDRKALSLDENCPKIIESLCNLCMVCQHVCKQQAITLPITQKTKSPQYNKVCVFLSPEHNLEGINLDLLNWGIKLSQDYNSKFVVITTQTEISTLVNFGPDQIIVIEKSTLLCSSLAKTLINIIKIHQPLVVLFGATALCRSIAAQVAATLRLGLSADCLDFKIDKDTNLLIQMRAALSGHILAEVLSVSDLPQLSIVMPKSAPQVTPFKKDQIQINRIECVLDGVDVLLKHTLRKKFSTPLERAEVVVGGGRGVGSAEGFKLLKELARLLGGSIGGTRGAVEAGWIEPSYQIGQSGTTVTPKLYIACGISGSIHHIVGIRNCQVIVAINTDPNAPIFKIAQYAIVEDLYKIIVPLIENLSSLQRISQK